ncbi:MAG TPA: glycine cleavage T C-terminal barrel domain-containing protein [Longimicrobiales bacterium]
MSDAALMHGATPSYDAAHDSAIVVPRVDRVQMRARGRDPVRMIQGLITNDLENARSGHAVYATMLTPKGRMVADLRIVRQDDGSVLLDLDRGALDAFVAHVKKYVPPMFAHFEAVVPERVVVGVYGPRAAAVVRAATQLDVADDAAEYATTHRDHVLAIATRDAGVPGFDLFIDAERGASLEAALVDAGAVAADAEVLDVLRVEAGRPRWGAELDDSRIPLEADLLERAISTSKGCYTGQEVIIRILHRGHVNWHLRGLLLGDAPPPPPGTELAVDGRTVARVTSAVRSPRLGETIALAYVRREVEPGRTLQLADGAPATVVALPFPTK